MDRNKAKKLRQEPESYEIAGEIITVEPMVIKHAKEFRREIKKAIISAVDQYKEEDWVELVNTIDRFLGDEAVNLVLKASPELQELGKDWIENNLTEGEVHTLLSDAIKINYPWLEKVADMGEFGRMYQQMQMEEQQKKK